MPKKALPKPSFEFERKAFANGFSYVAGLDEVGRGAFAGPLVVAAVIFPRTFTPIIGVTDSKLLPAKKRVELAHKIKQTALHYSLVEVPVAYINEFGVGKANQFAFTQALINLYNKLAERFYILVDGFKVKDTAYEFLSDQEAIVKGDQKSFSIAAASILAKVYRDSLMEGYHPQYAVYNFASNKGYGTADHRAAIKEHGLCDLHRTSFSLGKFL